MNLECCCGDRLLLPEIFKFHGVDLSRHLWESARQPVNGRKGPVGDSFMIQTCGKYIIKCSAGANAWRR